MAQARGTDIKESLVNRDNYEVFSEARIGNLVLKNRLIRSATYEASARDGLVTANHLRLYCKLAEGGVGLIITGHMAVSPKGQMGPLQTCIFDDCYIQGVSQIVETVRKCRSETPIIAQVNYAGRNVLRENKLAECVGPSDVPSPILKRRTRPLTMGEVENIVEEFVAAIVRVREAGFDGVQIHGAHGYLISSFLSPYTNRRNDRYGGSLENRTAIVREIVGLARQKVGPDYPILIKLNCDDFVPSGIDLNSFAELVKAIEKTGVDAIELSGGTWDCLAWSKEELGFYPIPLPEARTRIDSESEQSYFLKYAKRLDLHVPVILAGGNRSIERLEKIVKENIVGFFSLARPLIREPDLPRRWFLGQGPEIAACRSCNACLLSLSRGPLRCLSKKKTTHIVGKNIVRHLWRLLFK